jgi:hypothetical protein
MEEPQMLLEDIRKFARSLRSENSARILSHIT